MAVVRNVIVSGNPGHLTLEGVNPPAQRPKGRTVLQRGQQETTFRGGETVNDRLTVRDRHAIVNRGTEKSGRLSGHNDPILDGPSRPSLRVINRSLNPQQGSDATRNQDDRNRPYTANAQGVWIGQQDGSVQPIYGGVPGLWIPYGSYGGYTDGPVQGIQSPIAYGAPQDRPQKLPAGPPHGLHTATFPDYSQTLGRYMATPQMTAARQDRPSNSKIAGQSYSQTVQPQGQTGTVGVQGTNSAPRQVGYKPGVGWRGN